MTNSEETPQAKGVEVFLIMDDGRHEERVLPSNVANDLWGSLSRDFGIGEDGGRITRIKHGPLVASEHQLRKVNIASLQRAVVANCTDATLVADRSELPFNEATYESDPRYKIQITADGITAVVTVRYPGPPGQTEAEIEDALKRVAEAYECRIADVKIALYDGTDPKELLAEWRQVMPEFAGYLESFLEETREHIARAAHDVHVRLETLDTNEMSTLIDGATAIADFFKATRNGPLDAAGVLNLLRGGHFKALLGERESAYLEVKSQMYNIKIPRSTNSKGKQDEKAKEDEKAKAQTELKEKIELAQDVARFANGQVDAILIVGYDESNDKPKKIVKLTPVKVIQDVEYEVEQILDARIVPRLRGVQVKKFPVGDGGARHVLTIYVPRQPPELQPYLVHGVVVGGTVEGDFFSIVQRREEGSVTTTADQIHAYIVTGKAFLRRQET